MTEASPTTGSTVPRRQLGRYLRDLRNRARLTVRRAAAHLEWSEAKIWRIETGQTLAMPFAGDRSSWLTSCLRSGRSGITSTSYRDGWILDAVAQRRGRGQVWVKTIGASTLARNVTAPRWL